MSVFLRQFSNIPFFVLSFLLFFGGVAAAAEDMKDNMINDRIIFGQTADMSGMTSEIGLELKEGLLVAFKEINDKGGVHGKKLELISYDDVYDPDLAIVNAKKLIRKDKVFALVGGMGTPTANTLYPFITREKVPLIGQYTGVEFLRSPFNRYVLNIRSSYWQETEAWIEHLTSDLGIKRIAILYQDDTYGRAGLTGVKKAMEKRGLSLVSEATYAPGTVAVKSAVLRLRKTNAEAVVMISTYEPAAKFIKLSKQLGFSPVFVNMSPVNLPVFRNLLGEYGEGVIVSQVVPLPCEPEESALVKRYRVALEKFDPEAEIGFVSLEGYVVGRFLIAVLEHMSPEALAAPEAREKFIDKVYDLKQISLDDLVLHFGENDNQGMDDVFMTVLQKDGVLKSIKRKDNGTGHQ